jgi:hypothetical protein
MPETNHGKKQNPRGKREIFALMKMCEKYHNTKETFAPQKRTL